MKNKDAEKIKKVEQRIITLGIKKSHIAMRIGCTAMEFTHFLKGRRGLRVDSIEKLNRYLGL